MERPPYTGRPLAHRETQWKGHTVRLTIHAIQAAPHWTTVYWDVTNRDADPVPIQHLLEEELTVYKQPNFGAGTASGLRVIDPASRTMYNPLHASDLGCVCSNLTGNDGFPSYRLTRDAREGFTTFPKLPADMQTVNLEVVNFGTFKQLRVTR